MVKVGPNSPLIRTRTMTLHGRQQLPRHKNLYVRDLRPVAILGLFVCAVVSGIRARAAFPRARTQSVSCLSAAKCRLLLVHGAQALPIPSPLPALAAASPSPPGTVLLPDFPACQAKITVFAPKITLVVFAPTCSLHASLSRLPQLSPSPLSYRPSWVSSTFISIFSSLLSSLYSSSCLQTQPPCRWPLPFATRPNFTSVSLPCITS